jgi:hypothetical protein
MVIEAPVPINAYPVLDLNGQANLVNRGMGQQGDATPLGDFQTPPQGAIWTTSASGGCLPVCAAEVTPGAQRTVRWIYLFHGYGGNLGRNLAAQATNLNHVYAAFMLYSERNGLWSPDNSFIGKDDFFAALDPNDRIPNNNALLIYGDFVSLAITPNAHIGVLPGNAEPTPPVAGGGDGGCKCCFISTAACSTLGLPDDCDELMTLRWYRDAILLGSEEGRRDVQEYYAIAPGVVEVVDSRPDRRLIYRDIFRRYVRPAVRAIRGRQYARAHALFKATLRDAHRYQARPASSGQAGR